MARCFIRCSFFPFLLPFFVIIERLPWQLKCGHSPCKLTSTEDDVRECEISSVVAVVFCCWLPQTLSSSFRIFSSRGCYETLLLQRFSSHFHFWASYRRLRRLAGQCYFFGTVSPWLSAWNRLRHFPHQSPIRKTRRELCLILRVVVVLLAVITVAVAADGVVITVAAVVVF